MTNFRIYRPSRWERLRRSLTEWQRRSRSRQELEGLSDATLRDIGLTRCEVHREIRKPFWMA
jgi:uncharacterized protein YjiS (DUF1127 family)